MAFCSVRLPLKPVILDYYNLANVHDFSNAMGNMGTVVVQKVHLFNIIIVNLDYRNHVDVVTEHYVQVGSTNPLSNFSVYNYLVNISHDCVDFY